MTFSIHTLSGDEALVKNRREHIMRRAIRIFTKKGYHDTNMRELAKSCEMSTGMLYHYFGSKEEILYFIINTATFQQSEHVHNIAEKLCEINARDALIQLIRDFLQWHDQNQDITLFAYQETKNLPPNARQNIFDSELKILSVFEDLLTRGVKSGVFKVSDPRLVAHNIVALSHAWALRRWLLRKHWTWEEYAKGQTDAILKAIT